MKTKRIKEITMTIKELLEKAGIKGKMKYFDLGTQNTNEETTEVYIEVYEQECKEKENIK